MSLSVGFFTKYFKEKMNLFDNRKENHEFINFFQLKKLMYITLNHVTLWITLEIPLRWIYSFS